ncbi:hypothetical protein TSMEX_009436 [Taenia solium]|eukprot:TsM_000433300 transcript=TsM_000433300 gene=TsM_000433300
MIRALGAYHALQHGGGWPRTVPFGPLWLQSGRIVTICINGRPAQERRVVRPCALLSTQACVTATECHELHTATTTSTASLRLEAPTLVARAATWGNVRSTDSFPRRVRERRHQQSTRGGTRIHTVLWKIDMGTKLLTPDEVKRVKNLASPTNVIKRGRQLGRTDLYREMDYRGWEPQFHSFHGESGPVGLAFASPKEARSLLSAIQAETNSLAGNRKRIANFLSGARKVRLDFLMPILISIPKKPIKSSLVDLIRRLFNCSHTELVCFEKSNNNCGSCFKAREVQRYGIFFLELSSCV